jgi:hypothetical protein
MLNFHDSKGFHIRYLAGVFYYAQIYIKKKINTNKIAAVTMTYAFVASSFSALTEMSPFCVLERIRHFAKAKIENSQIAINGIKRNFIALPPFQQSML